MTWATGEDGVVSIDGEAPMLSGQALEIFQNNVVGRWLDASKEAAAATGVPLEWILATIFAESQGNAAALGHDPGGTTGVGLLQLTSTAAKGGLSTEELLDGPTNIRQGATFMARIRGSHDLPTFAATFNAGSPRPSQSNRWGLVSSPGYLDRIVSASNTAIAMGVNEGGSGGGKTSTGDKIIRVGCTFLAAIGLGWGFYRMVQR